MTLIKDVRGFLTPDYFVSQSHLPNSFTRRRQLSCLAVYGSLVAGATGLGIALPAIRAAALGLALPGAGFLHWATGAQLATCLLLFAGALLAFGLALILWFATGNVLAPPAIWIALAWLASEPLMLGLDAHVASPSWPLALAPAVFALLAATWAIGDKKPRPPACVPAMTRADAPSPPVELPLAPAQRVRLLLDRALQPAQRFDGFERRDQFQTAALRYQVNFVAYALAMAQHRHAPAAEAPFAQAQDRLGIKIGDRRLWGYWRLENAWGNLRIDADPVTAQNIMFSGFTLLQMALGGQEELVLHSRGETWRRYGMDEIAALLERQYRASRYGLLSCEPGWIYPLCNLITMAGIRAADARLGTNRWSALGASFLESLRREGMRGDGRFIAFRSSLTGIAPPAPGGIVMQAFPCLFLNALSPDMAQAHWQRVRARLDSRPWRGLFWPVDTGNYGFSRASSYAATAAAAAEMGDGEVAAECLRRLEQECPSREAEGAIHRERTSLWAHALEAMALCGGKNALRGLVTGAPLLLGPRLVRISCPGALVTKAANDGERLDLVLQPGGNGSASVVAIEIGGLSPGKHYRTNLPRQPLLRADAEGRGVLRVSLGGRTALSVEPFIAKESRWSAAP